MKPHGPYRRARFHSPSSTSTVTCTSPNEHSKPYPQTKSIEIPIQFDSPSSVPITVHQSRESDSIATAAVKIQSAYRSYVIRNLVKKISGVNSEANRLERLIQSQETVDAIRTDDRERIKVNEVLMGLLLNLDEVPGVDQTVRELRRHVSRRIAGLQEILDAVSGTTVDDWNTFFSNWDDMLERIEADVCIERGGEEMERFCAENLGLRCLQRFLRDQ